MRVRVGAAQDAALGVYFGPGAYEPEGFAFEPGGSWLEVYDVNAAFFAITEASNSADVDVERSHGEARRWARADRDALQRLAARVLREGS